jgi:hypothetical protein
MKAALVFLTLPAFALAAEDPAKDKELALKIAEHLEGSTKLALRQDELAADIQQLIIEQTNPKVIELLEGVEDAMDEASELLLETNTGGVTIAAETDVIEKIFEAAKERQKQQGQGQGNPDDGAGAMLFMMEQMMGKGKPDPKPGKPGEGQGEGNQGGEGKTGDSDTANSEAGGTPGGKLEERRVPKASGTAGQNLPAEFQQALDAYNRAAEKLAK